MTESTSPSLDPLAEIFAGPSHLGRPRHRVRKVVAGGAAVAALVLGGVAVANATGAEDQGLRTATIGTQSVDQVLDAVATVEPVSQAAVAFPVSGTVSRVDVKVGDTVVVGQPLAELDATSLERTLNQRQQALAAAELDLQKALDGEDVSSGGSAPTGSSPTDGSTPADGSSASDRSAVTTEKARSTSTSAPAGSTSTSTSAPTTSSAPSASTGAADDLRDAQQAVLDAQRAVDASLAVSQQALDAAVLVCGATETPGDPEGSDAAAGPSEVTTTTAPATDPVGTGGVDLAACQQALTEVLVAQQQVAIDQQALAAAMEELDRLLQESASSGGSTSNPDAPSGSDGSGASIPSGSAPTSGSGGSSPTSSDTDNANASASPSAAELVALQKAVDAAEAQVAVAEQAVDQATIVSPIAGTIAAVGLTVGDEVTAASATQAITIVGTGGFEVTTTISIDDLPDVEVGQKAVVRPDGTDLVLQAEVVAIGVAPSSSSSSTTSYPVTLAITGDTEELRNGSTASVSIVTAAARDALAVPTSAVTTAGNRHTVRVVDGSETTTATVEVGAVGATWTEITDGLEAGQEVVLADLSEPLPGSATSSSNGEDQNPFGGPGGGGPISISGGPPAGFPGGGARPGN